MRFIFIIILFLSVTAIKAQDVFILDSITNTPIENANLINQFSGVSSDINGLANLKGFHNIDTIMIKHISYHNKKIVKSKIGKVILLSPKIRILPTVILKENPKIYNFPDYLVIKKVSQRASASKSTTEKTLQNMRILVPTLDPSTIYWLVCSCGSLAVLIWYSCFA